VIDDAYPPTEEGFRDGAPPGSGNKMLILTRRAGERLIIGEDISITVLSVKGNQVRIGIDAPAEIKVHRDEVYQRILKEREASNWRRSSG